MFTHNNITPRLTCAFPIFTLLAIGNASFAQTLAVNPDNRHYFLYNNKPTVIVTSGEHYGAVINKPFDYVKYLDTLAKDGLNGTRVFSGSYFEAVGTFGIEQNSLAPVNVAADYIGPWKRTTTPKDSSYGNKFDLTQYDDDYFVRMKDFVQKASDRGIIVELNLFSATYTQGNWDLNPMNSANNVNGISGSNLYSSTGPYQAVQEALVRKIVTELNGYDNLYYEVANELYGDQNSDVGKWLKRMASVVATTEQTLSKKHLISFNLANGTMAGSTNENWKLSPTDPRMSEHVSIYNFHYAQPGLASYNWGQVDKIIGDNETGHNGTGDATYRKQGWGFILSGGALFNNLDFSFTVGNEDGKFGRSAPGGGSVELRKQLGVLKKFIDSVDFTRMRPTEATPFKLPTGSQVQSMSNAGVQYAAYMDLSSAGTNQVIGITLPKGAYTAQWIDARTGDVVEDRMLYAAADGFRPLQNRSSSKEYAVRITAVPTVTQRVIDGFGSGSSANYTFVPLTSSPSGFSVSDGAFVTNADGSTATPTRQGFLRNTGERLMNVGDMASIDVDFNNNKTSTLAAGGILLATGLSGDASYRLVTVQRQSSGNYAILIDGSLVSGGSLSGTPSNGILNLMVTKLGYDQNLNKSIFMAELSGGGALGGVSFDLAGNNAHFGMGVMSTGVNSVWLDNLSFATTAVPEPACVSLASTGLALLRRRRR